MTYVRIADGRACIIEGGRLRPIGRPSRESAKDARCRTIAMEPHVVIVRGMCPSMHVALAA